MAGKFHRWGRKITPHFNKLVFFCHVVSNFRPTARLGDNKDDVL